MSPGHSGTDAANWTKYEDSVTISDECFEAQYIGLKTLMGRDGCPLPFQTGETFSRTRDSALCRCFDPALKEFHQTL